MSQNSDIERALEEAYASAPQDIIVLDTLEIYHRTFDTPIRIVRWPITGPQPDVFKLRLESNAPADPGKTVDFIGAPFEMKVPDVSLQDVVGTFEMRVDFIGDYLDQHMETAALDGGIITGTYRTFIKGMENQGPSSRWSDLEFENPRFEGMTFVINAATLRWAVRPYGRLYTAMEYPALVAGR